MPSRTVSMSITITDKDCGGKATIQKELGVSSLGGMNVNEEYMGLTTCPVCATSLRLWVGLSEKSNNSNLLGSDSTQESSTGIDELKIAYLEPDQCEISSATQSLILTAQAISYLKLLPGLLNLPSPCLALVELCNSM